MRNRKEIITTAGTLACAVGIGFFMQQTQSVPGAEYQGAPLANAEASVLSVEEIVLTSANFDEEEVGVTPEEDVMRLKSEEIASPQQSSALPQQDEMSKEMVDDEETAALDTVDTPVTDTSASQETCLITANARPMAAAMVNLTLNAPCLAGERVTVHHSGLLFHQSTDAEGAFDIAVPAMTREAVFIVAFSNGEGAVAQTSVDELSDYDRVALQWKGDTGFGLHALEFGADYGTEGHVYAEATRDMAMAVTGQGGFMSRLGDKNVPDGLLAEVYTFPTGITSGEGTIDLSVETEVAENNCGLEIEAQTLQTSRGLDITTKDLTLSVPDCDATGNFLVLKNLFEDLKVASR